jgi:phage portal protein BeeE
MSLLSLVKNFVRPNGGVAARPSLAKSSLAGPMIAWSNVGQPRWTNRRYDAFAEEDFRKNVIAYRCMIQISTASAVIPWLSYDDEGNEVYFHPLPGLMQHPNPLQDGETKNTCYG